MRRIQGAAEEYIIPGATRQPGTEQPSRPDPAVILNKQTLSPHDSENTIKLKGLPHKIKMGGKEHSLKIAVRRR